jgi:hypothetical protein
LLPGTRFPFCVRLMHGVIDIVSLQTAFYRGSLAW